MHQIDGSAGKTDGKLTDIYVDGAACPVREEIYHVAGRLKVKVFVVSNGSRPIWHLGYRVTSDIPLASRYLNKGARVVSPTGKQWTEASIGNALAPGMAMNYEPVVAIAHRQSGTAATVHRTRAPPPLARAADVTERLGDFGRDHWRVLGRWG